MLKIRTNTFETNSSSTHSITMCSSDQYTDWVRGRCFYDMSDDTFIYISLEDRNNLILNSEEYNHYSPKLEIDEFLRRNCYDWPLSFEEWEQYITEYETFYAEFNNVVAFGYYGDNY